MLGNAPVPQAIWTPPFHLSSGSDGLEEKTHSSQQYIATRLFWLAAAEDRGGLT